MLGKISFGVRRIANDPLIKMKIARTINVYGLRKAKLTIHISCFWLSRFRAKWPWLFKALGVWVIGSRADCYAVAGPQLSYPLRSVSRGATRKSLQRDGRDEQ